MADPLPSWSKGCFSFGVRGSFEQPLFPDSDKLKPSSSTETESSWPDVLVPLQYSLTAGERESQRQCASVGKRWIERRVPKNHLANVPTPHCLDWLVRLCKTGTIRHAPSILVPRPKEIWEESKRLQTRFSGFWLSLLCGIVFIGLRWSAVWLLRKLWTHGKRVDDKLSQYIR